MKIRLIASTDIAPLDLTAHAAKTCYMSKEPEMGSTMDVENALFKVGHHTTLQHFYLTFAVEGIAIADLKMGLHMCSPFYNTDERSGRYCAKIFSSPDLVGIEEFVVRYYPDLGADQKDSVMAFIQKGLSLYDLGMPKATELAKIHLMKERPAIKEEVAVKNAPKVAMEQMRVFIPAIMPTGLDFTVNLTALAALNSSAWRPSMRAAVDMMVGATLDKYPELSFMFKNDNQTDWSPTLLSTSARVTTKPTVKLISFDKDCIVPKSHDTHPIDLLHFRPEYMENSVNKVRYQVGISLVTMGQDQRHRTIQRSTPEYTGEFYLPPLCKLAGLEEEAKKLLQEWISLRETVPHTLCDLIAPFGTVLTYQKSANYNALIHEQAKRLCWCAQEEIYHIAAILRRQIIEEAGKDSVLVKLLEPECYSRGVCAEGDRYCGRKLSIRKTGDYFPDRVV